MKSLDRKLRRESVRSALLLGAIAGIVAVGNTCFVAMRSSYNNLRLAQQAYYRACRMADFWITLRRAPQAELATRMNVPGVQEWQGRIEIPGRLLLPHVPFPVNARLISWGSSETAMLNRPWLKRGSGLSGMHGNEVLINEKFARAYGIQPGDRIRVISQRRESELVVRGTFISSEFTYAVDVGQLVPDPRRFAVCFVPRELAEELADMKGAVNQVVGVLSPDGSQVAESVVRLLEERLAEFGVLAAVPRGQQSSHQVLDNEIQGLRAFAYVVPTIFLVAAALVLHVFLGRLMRQQRTVLGTLAALGYSKYELLRHYLAFGMVVGLAGATAGSCFGQLVSWGLTVVYRWYFEFPRLEAGWYFSVHITAFLAALAAAASGSYRAIDQLLRLRPAEAMRPEPPFRARKLWLERWPWLWSRLDLGWRIVLRHLARRPGRTATTILASTAGASFLVAGLMFVSAQNYLLDFQFRRTMKSHLDFVLHDPGPREAWQRLSQLPDLGHTEPQFAWPCVFRHEHRRRLGTLSCLFDGAQLTVPHDQHGRPIRLPHAGVVLTRKLAELLDVRVGDRLHVEPVRGERRVLTVPVAQVADSYLGLSAYARLDYLHELLQSEFVVDTVQSRWHGSLHTSFQLWEAIAEIPRIQTVRVQRETVDQLRRTLLQNQFVFITVLVLFSGAVLFGNIVNAQFVSLQERNREVAILAAMGYELPLLGSTFLREALLVNLIAAILGIAGGYFLTWLTALSYESEFLRLPVVLRSWNIGIAWLLTIVFTVTSYGIVFRALRRLNIRDVLYIKE